MTSAPPNGRAPRRTGAPFEASRPRLWHTPQVPIATDRRQLAKQLLDAETAFNLALDRHEAERTDGTREALAKARDHLEAVAKRARWVGRGES